MPRHESDLANVYREIAGDLKDEAGVNTTMGVDYQNINVTGVTLPGVRYSAISPIQRIQHGSGGRMV